MQGVGGYDGLGRGVAHQGGGHRDPGAVAQEPGLEGGAELLLGGGGGQHGGGQEEG